MYSNWYSVLCFWVVGLLILPNQALSQESAHLKSHNFFHPDAWDYQKNELSALAIHELEMLPFEDIQVHNEAKNVHILQERRAIDLLIEATRRNNSSPTEQTAALFKVANIYFSRGDYENATAYFRKLDADYLEGPQLDERAFKIGYASLTEKQFEDALTYFEESEQYKGLYKSSSIYYSGICQYYLGMKEEAIASFRLVDNHANYKNVVPFYLAQIYFKDGDYDRVIEYASSKLNNGSIDNKDQIDRILGLSYLAKEDYTNALKHLNAYASHTPRLSENELYQFAILNYKLGQLDKSQEYLAELSPRDTPIGQMSNYLLASIFLDKGQKNDAQAAFKQASKTQHFPNVQQESQFNYLKLAADLGQERVAINGLNSLSSSSSYYRESQNILSDVLANSSDHEMAIQTLENIPTKNEKLNDTYKDLTFQKGQRQVKEGEYRMAIQNLEKSLNTKGNVRTSHQTQFYLGLAHHEIGDSETSEKHLIDYLQSGHRENAFESRYILAYQNIDSKDYKTSLKHLEKAVSDFNPATDDKALLNDVLIRLADLELLNNDYNSAIAYYDMAIKNDVGEADYILYQKSMIEGVNNQHIDKITHLEELLRKYPESAYGDDALFEIGESLIALKKHNEAHQIYNELILTYGDRSEYTATSHMRQGLLSYNSGDNYAALNFYKQGYKTSKNKEERRQALIAIEEIYVKDLNEPEAFFAFTENEGGIKISNISKDSITYIIALDAYKDNEYTKAIELFNKYTARYPEGIYHQDALYHIGESYTLQKAYGQALPFYEKLIQDGTNKYALTALKKAALIAYNHEQDFKKSFQYYDALYAEHNIHNLEVIEAALYSAFKYNHQEGIEKYGNIAVNEPKISNESKSAAYYYLGKLYNNSQQKDLAITAFSEVVKLSTNNHAAESSYSIAKIMFEAGDLEEAEKKAFETTQVAAHYPVFVAKSLILLGDIFDTKNDHINATAAYESVIENFKENPLLVTKAQEKLKILKQKIEDNSRIIDNNELDAINFIPTETQR